MKSSLHRSMHIYFFVLCLVLIENIPLLGQDHIYGTSDNQVFNNVIADGQKFYIIGQEDQYATISHTDHAGSLEWTIKLDEPAIISDGILTTSGLLFIGYTLPVNSTNQSIIGQIDHNGVLICLSKIDGPGAEQLNSIEQNPGGTYSAVGYHTGILNDIVIYTISTATAGCTIVNKKAAVGPAPDDFGNDIVVTSSGDILICGKDGSSKAVIYKMDSNGNFFNGVQGPDQFTYVDIEAIGADLLAAATSINTASPRIIRFDQELLPVWEVEVLGLSSIRQIITDVNDMIYIVGTAIVSGQVRSIILKLNDNHGTSFPIPAFLGGSGRYLDNTASNYSQGFLTAVSSSEIAYVDGRKYTGSGFGMSDGFFAIEDADLNANCGFNVQLVLSPTSTTFNGPIGPFFDFYDTPPESAMTVVSVNFQQLNVCSSTCAAAFTYQYLDDCGLITFSNQSTGVLPLSYCWDYDGVPIVCESTLQNPSIQFPSPACHTWHVCLTITAGDGCMNTKCQSVVVEDIIDPMITCPPNILINCTNNSLPVNTGQATASDNCVVSPVITYVDQFIGTNPCNRTIERTWTAMDECGNPANCKQIITVLDNIAPLLTKCPPDITVVANDMISPCHAFVFIMNPIAQDCLPIVPTNSFNGQTNASGTYPEGTTNVIFTATDDCGNSSTCLVRVTVVCDPIICSVFCQTNSINISTGYTITSPIPFSPGSIDNLWSLVSAPSAVSGQIGPLPRPAYLIGPYANDWSHTTTSTWLSAYPFNNYTALTCSTLPVCSTCEPFVYERSFCLCEDDMVTFDFSFLSDNAGEVEIWNGTTSIVLASNCAHPIAVSNSLVPEVVHTTIPLQQGFYKLRIKHWNFNGDPMGVNLQGTISSAHLEKVECCTYPATGVAVSKFNDLNCDGMRDLDITNWTTNEPGLPGWVFTIDNFSIICPPGGYTITTNDQGFAFDLNNCMGPIRVTESLQNGWICSTYPVAPAVVLNLFDYVPMVVEFGNCACNPGPNLIVNGDFSAWNSGFTSDYFFAWPFGIGPGLYTVTNFNYIIGSSIWECVDHTTGLNSAPFFSADASLIAGKAAWRQSVTVAPSGNYTFRAYANNIMNPFTIAPDPEVELWIIGSDNIAVKLTSAILPEMPDQWVKLEAVWISPAVPANPYRLEIRSGSIVQFGNDFAIDDISFNICTPPQTCICETFSDVRIASGGVQTAVACNEDLVPIDCWEASGDLVVTGLLTCSEDSCNGKALVGWDLILLPDSIVASGETSSSPFFAISLSPFQLIDTGAYLLRLRQTPSTSFGCRVRFNLICPELCPFDSMKFESDVRKGFASTFLENKCEACFSPISLNDCDAVNWFVDSINGPPVATSDGNEPVCIDFINPGIYTLTMEVTRAKREIIQYTVRSKRESINIDCGADQECVNTLLINSGFGQGAISGGLISGGHSTNWQAFSGDPVVMEGIKGSLDGWAILLKGNHDTSDILTNVEPICLQKGPGNLSIRMRKDVLETKTNRQMHVGFSPPDRLIGSVSLSVLDSADWVEFHLPYDLTDWISDDSCDNESVQTHLQIFVTNPYGSGQGGEDTYSRVIVDNICINEIATSISTPHIDQVGIYPNPTSGKLNIELSGYPYKPIQIRVLNLTGQVVLLKNFNAGIQTTFIETDHLAPGFYFIQIESEGQFISSCKFVKQ